MTPEQEEFAEQIINELKDNDGIMDTGRLNASVHANAFPNELLVKERLCDMELVEYRARKTEMALLPNGFNFVSFEALRNEEIAKKTKEDQISDLTLEQLKKSLFQLKNWWWILLINIVLSGIIAFVVAMMTK